MEWRRRWQMDGRRAETPPPAATPPLPHSAHRPAIPFRRSSENPLSPLCSFFEPSQVPARVRLTLHQWTQWLAEMSDFRVLN